MRVIRELSDRDIENALGRICPRCGAVMEQRKRVIKYQNENIDCEFWKCGHCGFRDD